MNAHLQRTRDWFHARKTPVIFAGAVLLVGLMSFVLVIQAMTLNEINARVASLERLSVDVAQLRTTWTALRSDDMQQRVHAAEDMLLSDFEDLAAWLQHVEHRAASMQLQTHVRVDPLESDRSAFRDVSYVAVDMHVMPEDPAMLNGAYRRYLRLYRAVAQDTIRVDVRKVAIHGGEGATRMTLGLHVWMRQVT